MNSSKASSIPFGVIALSASRARSRKITGSWLSAHSLARWRAVSHDFVLALTRARCREREMALDCIPSGENRCIQCEIVYFP
jgi:hypothetical protein